MAKALIVCSTRTGETRQFGELIAESLRIAGAEAVVKDVKLKTLQQAAGNLPQPRSPAKRDLRQRRASPLRSNKLYGECAR